jgi:hypothetical protein
MDNDEIDRFNYLKTLNDIKNINLENNENIYENLENDNNHLLKTNNIQKSNKNIIQNRIRYVKTPYIIRSKL